MSYLNITSYLDFLSSLHCQSFLSKTDRNPFPTHGQIFLLLLREVSVRPCCFAQSHQHPSHPSSAVLYPLVVAQPDLISSWFSTTNSFTQAKRLVCFQVFTAQAEGKKQTPDIKLCKASFQSTSMTKYENMPIYQAGLLFKGVDGHLLLLLINSSELFMAK